MDCTTLLGLIKSCFQKVELILNLQKKDAPKSQMHGQASPVTQQCPTARLRRCSRIEGQSQYAANVCNNAQLVAFFCTMRTSRCKLGSEKMLDVPMQGGILLRTSPQHWRFILTLVIALAWN